MDLTSIEIYRKFDPNKSKVDDDYADRVLLAIGSVSAKFENHLMRGVEITERTEYFTPVRSGTRFLYLTSYPVTSVASVTIEDVLIDSSEYVMNKMTGRLSLKNPEYANDDSFPDSIEVVYTGGMAADSEAFIAKFPDITAEANAQIRFELTRITSIAESAFSSDGRTTQLTPYNLIPSVVRMLSMYRRKRGLA